jgi:hypothetical protein
VAKLSLKHFLSGLLLILLFSIVTACVSAQTGEGGGGGFEGAESHCALGSLGFILLLGTLAAGFLVSGRFGRIAGFKPLPVHKIAVVAMALFLTGEFIYGSLVRGVLFVNSTHGTLGFLTVTLAWLTVSLNPLAIGKLVKWKYVRAIHLILAVTVFSLLIIHLAYAFSLFGD